jgi:hypothetical protein
MHAFLCLHVADFAGDICSFLWLVWGISGIFLRFNFKAILLKGSVKFEEFFKLRVYASSNVYSI